MGFSCYYLAVETEPIRKTSEKSLTYFGIYFGELLDLAYKYNVTCCPWTSEGLRRRDRPTLMLPAPDNAVAAGGGVESRGHVSEGVMCIVSRYPSGCEVGSVEQLQPTRLLVVVRLPLDLPAFE